MGRIVVKNHVTLDGVMQGPGREIQSLIPAYLMDAYLLMIHPLVLGRGLRLFPNGLDVRLMLTGSVATLTGAPVVTYEPECD